MGATGAQISLIFNPKGKKQCPVPMDYCSVGELFYTAIKHFPKVPAVALQFFML